ncbi:MAG: response regulator [Candidatus Eisenbacteria bacterium]|uniref:Response regulator n=1 Tax=Eiseniibacteriota bacterium TaxID=2212470 RepID=A0A538T0S9_UNCEI|nr:MAG: response regulator [Candidatus Eisenbacteria bacterium]
MSPDMRPAFETKEGKQKRTILVVDDDRRVVDLLQISLSQNGYHVTTAGTGEEALESVRRETPHLVILDLRLPKKNGYEVCAALKSSKDTSAIPIIMVSATAEVDARLQGLMHGADDYLTKPFSPKELLIKVRRIFERQERAENLSIKNQELETEVARNREDLVVRNKELRFQVFSLETLMGLTHQLNSSLDLEGLLSTMILSVVGQLRVNSACLFLTDERENPKRLDAMTFKGVKEDLVRSIHFEYEDEFLRAVLPVAGEEGRPVRLGDLSEDPSLERCVGPLYAAGFTLVCPVMMKQKLTALLAVGEKVSGQEFQSTDLEMVKALSESAGIAIENARLFKDLQETYLATVRVLVSTIEAKDPYTHGHTERVAQYSVGIAKEMDFTQDEIQTIQLGAFLHDIGKLHTSDSILHKPGALTDEEWRMVKAHPVRGAQMLQGVKFLEKATDLVRHHHERVDGKGYPDGLRGDEITIGAKIVNVADAFDAMTTERPYRQGLTMEQAVAQLEDKAGTQFAKEIVEVMVKALREGRMQVLKNESPWRQGAKASASN